MAWLGEELPAEQQVGATPQGARLSVRSLRLSDE